MLIARDLRFKRQPHKADKPPKKLRPSSPADKKKRKRKKGAPRKNFQPPDVVVNGFEPSFAGRESAKLGQKDGWGPSYFLDWVFIRPPHSYFFLNVNPPRWFLVAPLRCRSPLRLELPQDSPGILNAATVGQMAISSFQIASPLNPRVDYRISYDVPRPFQLI